MQTHDRYGNAQINLVKSTEKTVTLTGNVPNGDHIESAAWEDARGYRDYQIGVASDAAHNADVHIQWSFDGTNTYAEDADVVTLVAAQYNLAAAADTKGPYFKILVNNTAVAAHDMTVTVQLRP